MTYYETTFIITIRFNFKYTIVRYSKGEPDMEKLTDDALSDVEGMAPNDVPQVESVFTRAITEEEYLEGIKKK